MDAGAAVALPHHRLPDQLRVEPFGLDAATLANHRGDQSQAYLYRMATTVWGISLFGTSFRRKFWLPTG